MRFLYLLDLSIDDFYPLLTEVFGKRLQDRGHTVIWVTRPEGAETYRETTRNGQQMYVLPQEEYSQIRSFTKYVTRRSQTSRVFDIFERHRPLDFVQVRNDLSMALAASAIQRQTGCPFVYRITHLKAETMHYMAVNGQSERPIRDYLKSQLGKRLRNHLINQAQLVLPISEAMQAELADSGAETPMEPLPTGADTQLSKADTDPQRFRNRFDIGDEELILYMGSMSPSRNLELLFDVVQDIDMDGRLLVMVGGRDPKNRRRLQQLARETGVADSVLFTGWLDDRDLVYDANAAASVGVNPLPTDNILRTSAPIKVLEYLLFETPVVVSDAPDQQQIVEATGAGYAVPYETGAFAEALSEFFTLSEAEREMMGANGRAFIQRERDFDTLTAKLLQIYEDYGLADGVATPA